MAKPGVFQLSPSEKEILFRLLDAIKTQVKQKLGEAQSLLTKVLLSLQSDICLNTITHFLIEKSINKQTFLR